MFMLTGDSVTDAQRDRANPASLGRGYPALLASDLPGEVRNTGIAGNRVADLQARWDHDVLALSPRVLTILIGINDTWHRYDAADPTSVDAFAHSYADLLARARAATIEHVVLIEPFLLPVRDEQWTWREDLDPKIQAIRRLAHRFDVGYVATDGPLAQRARQVGAVALAEDGVHPTPLGHEVLAELLLTELRRRALA